MGDIDFRPKHLQLKKMVGIEYMPNYTISREWETIKLPVTGKVYKMIAPKYSLSNFSKKIKITEELSGLIKFKAVADYKPGGLYKVELFRCEMQNKKFNLLIYSELFKVASSVISTNTNKVIASKIVDGYIVAKKSTYKLLDIDNSYCNQVIDMIKNSDKEYDDNIFIFLDACSVAKDHFLVNNKEISKVLLTAIKSSKVYNIAVEKLKISDLKFKKSNVLFAKGLDSNYYLEMFKENYKYEDLTNIELERKLPKENFFKGIRRELIYKINSNCMDLTKLFDNVPFEINEEYTKRLTINMDYKIIVEEQMQRVGIGLVDWYGNATGIPLKILMPVQFDVYLCFKYDKNSNEFLLCCTKRDFKYVINDFLRMVKQQLLICKENILF